MSGEKYIIERHQEHPRFAQDNLPQFNEEEALARESSIPVEARKEHISRMYWRFRKYSSMCSNGSQDNMMRAWKLGQFFERQR